MGYKEGTPTISKLFPHSEYIKELNVAYKVVQDAMRVCENIWAAQRHSTLIKADSSPVTRMCQHIRVLCDMTLIVADFTAQLVIARAIRESFPVDDIIAEEDISSLSDDQLAQMAAFTDTSCLAKLLTEHSSTKSRFWVVDPIDGTLGYINDGQYACCIGLLEDGKAMVAVLGCPRLVTPLGKGAIFVAAHNCGSFLVCPDSGEWSKLPLACNTANGIVTLVESREKKHSDMSFSQELMARLGIESRMSMDSQCKYGLVAARCAHVFLRKSADPNYRTRIWVKDKMIFLLLIMSYNIV